MIYGYIVDEALHNWESNALLGSQVNKGAGYASENVLEYFNNVNVIRDNRSSRYAYLGSGVTMYGRLGFLVDNQPPDSDGCAVTADDSDAVTSDKLNYAGLSVSDLTRIFNIIEDVMYYRSGISGQLVADFLNLRFSSNSAYSGYKVGSLAISSENNATDETFISDITGTDSAGNIVEANVLNIPQWFSFTFETASIGTITFKLWIKESVFLTDYPYSTITNVILPCAAADLADPSRFTTPLSTLVGSGAFVNEIYQSDLRDNESTGVSVFSTAYYPETYTGLNTISMPFGVIYKGAVPSTSLLKKAIRKKLLEEGELIGVLENTWIEAFPDLFIASKFYLIPQWNNTYLAGEETLIECGITRYSALLSMLKAAFPYKSESFLTGNLEVLLNDATNLLIMSIPDEANDSGKKLSTIHRPYIPVDGINETDPLWNYQPAATRTFNRMLSYAIAYGRDGVSNPQNLTVQTVDCGNDDHVANRDFVLFSWNHVEYYVMTKAAFTALE